MKVSYFEIWYGNNWFVQLLVEDHWLFWIMFAARKQLTGYCCRFEIVQIRGIVQELQEDRPRIWKMGNMGKEAIRFFPWPFYLVLIKFLKQFLHFFLFGTGNRGSRTIIVIEMVLRCEVEIL